MKGTFPRSRHVPSRDDAKRCQGRVAPEGRGLDTGARRRCKMARGVEIRCLHQKNKENGRMGGSAAETIHQPRDRLKRQPQEGQHSAAVGGTRDRLPPARGAASPVRDRSRMAENAKRLRLREPGAEGGRQNHLYSKHPPDFSWRTCARPN
jgi:hypothetical protein